jgi:hypothetical protein
MADYYSVIARAVSRLPSKTDEARHGIYERARTALRETLNNYDPALSDTALANEQAALETAISRLEADLSFSDMRRAPREAIAKYLRSWLDFWPSFAQSEFIRPRRPR